MADYELLTIMNFIVLIIMATVIVESYSGTLNPDLMKEKLMDMSRIKREYDSYHPTDASLTSDMLAEVVTVKEKYRCWPDTICGWFLYDKRTKKDMWFVPNPECLCAPNKACLRNFDDFQGGTYVYYCQEQIPTTTLVGDLCCDDCFC